PCSFESLTGLHSFPTRRSSDLEDYPITPKEHGVEFLMDQRHLWIRSQRQWAILRVRATIIKAIRGWLDDHGFLNVDTPILTPAADRKSTRLNSSHSQISYAVFC